MKKIGGVFAFKVKGGPNGEEAVWFVDVKNGKGCVHNDTGENYKYSYRYVLTAQQWILERPNLHKN